MNIVNDFKREMISQYYDYVKNISSMAPSMKTLALIMTLCLPGAKVLDLGSGFSSYMLRYYEERLDLEVWSVDDNAKWLQKTRDYCGKNKVSLENFHTWDAVMDAQGDPPEFDVIFMDLGTTRNRPNYYPTVLEKFCSPKTLLLCDDMHKPTLKRALEHELKAYDYINIGVMDQTKDEYGRYCKLVFRLRPKGEQL